MKKIMFSDRFELTQAVIDRIKTRTFRSNKVLNHPLVKDISKLKVDKQGRAYVTVTYNTGVKEDVYPAYQVGEEVAVAQSYSSIEREIEKEGLSLNIKDKFRKHKGWTNKMFVCADLMPHRIRITNIRVERLQDISEEDCMREGIRRCIVDTRIYKRPLTLYSFLGAPKHVPMYRTPKNAFAALIDKMSGKGTWEKNPWGFVYEFESVK